MKKANPQTPIRSALKVDSPLHAAVLNGLAAMKPNHISAHVDLAVRSAFADSLDIDEIFRPGHDQEHRWDYLLGHAASNKVLGLEPHSAKQDEITRIIRKKQEAAAQLRDHLQPSARIAAWPWVASGKVHFADTEKARLRLDQHGIQFIGRRLLAKHLPAGRSRTPNKTSVS
jgi:hypothetical protein